uniref:LuxR family transcriptional regulator n=1 Tax=Muribaculaceae bacterium Z82 TaxID=2304548 RepID=A0A7C9KAD0_9BACT
MAGGTSLGGRPWYLAGFGLLWYYWIVTILFPGETGVLFAQTPSRIVTLGATAAASVLMLGARRRLPRMVGSAWFYAVAAFLLSAGTAICFFAPTFFPLPDAVMVAPCVMYGLGNGVCLNLFFSSLEPRSLREARFGIVSSISLGLAFYLVCVAVHRVSEIGFGAVETSFALLSIPLYVYAARRQGRGEARKNDLIGNKPLAMSVVRVSSIMAAFGVLVGVSARGFDEGQAAVLNTMMPALSIITLALFAVYVQRNTKVADILQCGKFAVVIGALGLMLQLVSSAFAMASALVFFVAYVLFLSSMFVFYVVIARYQVRFALVTLLSFALVADSVGLAAGFALHAYIVLVSPQALLSVLFLAASFFIIAGAFFFNKHTLFPVGGPGKGSYDDPKGVYVACVQLAEEHRLTPRQKEVLCMLGRGKRVQAIAKELVLSPGTVRSHVHQIYEKLGVHSNGELMALIGDADVKTVDQL